MYHSRPCVIKDGKVLLPDGTLCQGDVLLQDGQIVELDPIHAPNGMALMGKFLAAFHKVFNNLDQALDHADDPIYPGADGRLYGAG